MYVPPGQLELTERVVRQTRDSIRRSCRARGWYDYLARLEAHWARVDAEWAARR